MSLRIITTGGTLDKIYDPIKGELAFPAETCVTQIMRAVAPRTEYILQQVMMVDSLFMTDEQREEIVQSVVASEQTEVIVTHGTDTMNLTAFEIAMSLRRARSAINKAKRVALVGAMRPYDFGDSDALPNLRNAVSLLPQVDSGVYVSMSGLFLPHDTIVKNKDTGVFEQLPSADSVPV